MRNTINGALFIVSNTLTKGIFPSQGTLLGSLETSKRTAIFAGKNHIAISEM